MTKKQQFRRGKKLWQLKVGYQIICVGTLTQVQRAQASIEACTPVETEFANGEEFFLTDSRWCGTKVEPCRSRLVDQREVEAIKAKAERAKQKKITNRQPKLTHVPGKVVDRFDGQLFDEE